MFVQASIQVTPAPATRPNVKRCPPPATPGQASLQWRKDPVQLSRTHQTLGSISSLSLIFCLQAGSVFRRLVPSKAKTPEIMKSLALKSICLGATIAAFPSLHAQVLVFGNSTSASYTDVFESAVGTAGAMGTGFLTGGTALTLHSINVTVQRSSTQATIRARIFTDTDFNEVPDTTGFTTLTISGSQPGAGATAVVTFTGSMTLAANTQYYIVIENSGIGGTVTWLKDSAGNATTPTASGGSGYTAQGSITSTSDTFASGNTASTQSPSFLLNSTAAVPEPHEYALIAGLGLCGFAVYRRRSMMAKA